RRHQEEIVPAHEDDLDVLPAPAKPLQVSGRGDPAEAAAEDHDPGLRRPPGTGTVRLGRSHATPPGGSVRYTSSSSGVRGAATTAGGARWRRKVTRSALFIPALGAAGTGPAARSTRYHDPSSAREPEDRSPDARPGLLSPWETRAVAHSWG